MDLLEQPDIKKTYEKCKYIVKLWEHNFKKKHNRLPSKLDIKEADNEVKYAYKKYFLLKSAALEQSFMDVDGFEEEPVSNDEKTNTEPNTLITEPNKNLTEAEDCKPENSLPENGIQEHQEKITIPDDVWGKHLTNKQEDKTEKKKEQTKIPNLNLSISKKLYCGSKFTKRNPRKSLSFSQKTKSDVNCDNQISVSQPPPTIESYTFKSEEAFSSMDNIFTGEKIKIVTPTVNVSSQSINIIQSVLQNKYQPSLKTVDTGWLERVVKKTGNTIENPDLPMPGQSTAFNVSHNFSVGAESTKVDYDSDDIIYDSDEDDDRALSADVNTYHIGKKRRIEQSENKKIEIINTSDDKRELEKNMYVQLSNILDVTTIPQTKIVENTFVKNDVSKIETACGVIEKCNLEENRSAVEVNKGDNKKDKKVTKTSPKISHRKTKKGQTKKNAKKVTSEDEEISPRRSSRKTKTKYSLEELSCDIEEQDAFHTDTDEKDPEFTLESTKSPRAKTSLYDQLDFDDELPTTTAKKSKPLKSTRSAKKAKETPKVESEDDESDEKKPYELEFSVKPRIVAPRYNNIKKVLTEKIIVTHGTSANSSHDKKDEPKAEIDSYTVKDKRQQAKENLEKKVASGKLNDNFVRINLKKKVFARGKSGRTFSKYKKALWKSKKKALCGPDMDMGGCDGGMLTCFNCGQIGHFARNCQATKGDGLLPMAPDQEEECPYPTLEEAAQMAKDNVLSVRVPKMIVSNKNNANNDESDEENSGSESEVKGNQIEEDEGMEFDDDLSEQLLAETLKLEEHIKKLDVRLYMDTVKVVRPYYALNEDGSMTATPLEVYETLRMFGHSSFRPGQEQAIMRILSGKSTLVTLSTGSGKSLCYQLPAYLYSQREPCISLIISPLVSLMDDQIVGIPKFMKAACLHSNQTKVQRTKILEAISMGELSVLLVSPEAVVAGEKQSGFGSLLRKLPPIAFACIDEAHCVSQWSHNFRPSYLMICQVLRESLGVKTILGLTATATRATRDSIIDRLQIPDGHDGVISDIPLPDNLILTVSKDAMRDHALVGLLTSERFKDCKSVIVYCTRREECERIAAFLRTTLKSEEVVEETAKKRKRANCQAEPYHAGLRASRRRTIQNMFMSGELKIVVATVAFGMGINKSDIRAVIHYNMPNSFESYVQEVGRAGRDGLKAQCHVFLDAQGQDENELRRHIHANSLDRHVIRKLLHKVFVPCSCSGLCPKHEVAFSIQDTIRALDVPEQNIATLLCYLQLHNNKYIELLSPGYTMCKVISYGGPLQIRKVAKDCPPLAMALALHKSKEGEDPNVLEFPVVDVAAAMGWESGICKHKLKNLEWTTVNNQPKRSMISVQFSNLGFRLLAPGNLTDDQLDEALDNLYNRVIAQEKKAVMQLHIVHKTLTEVAQRSYRMCLSESGDSTIKRKVRQYFNSSDPLQSVCDIEPKKFNEELLVNDIRGLINMYKDNTFTGRAVARIFQGIESPNYPAVIWGRCKFWRKHLDTDFQSIVKVATREIIRMR